MGLLGYVLNDGILGVVDAPVWVIVLAAFVFVFARSWVYYHGGRMAARGAGRTRFAQVMDSPKFTGATSLLDRYGAAAVALSFVLLGTGTATTVGAGFLGMDKMRFLIGIIPGSAAWAIIRTAVGLAVVDVVYYLVSRSPAILGAAIAALAVLGVGFLVLLRLRR